MGQSVAKWGNEVMLSTQVPHALPRRIRTLTRCETTTGCAVGVAQLFAQRRQRCGVCVSAWTERISVVVAGKNIRGFIQRSRRFIVGRRGSSEFRAIYLQSIFALSTGQSGARAHSRPNVGALRIVGKHNDSWCSRSFGIVHHGQVEGRT